MKYIFILGRNPDLSLIELKETLNPEIISQSGNLIMAELEHEPDISQLGGTVRIARVLIENKDPEELEYELTKLNLNIAPAKLIYYVTGNSGLKPILEDYLKSYFKEQKIKAQYRKQEPAPADLNKPNRIEFILHKNIIAKTIQVTNPKEFKFRDISRPDVDFLKATSIRLAKIMVNLSRLNPGETLLDPFCGSGTILGEAMLKNVNVIGVDIDKTSVEQSGKNLEWLKNTFNLKASYEIIQADISQLSSRINSADAVVTEPYMGEFLKKYPAEQQKNKTIKQLNAIYNELFNQLKSILKPNSRIVIIFPYSIKPQYKHFTILYKIPYNYKHNILKRNIYVLEYNSKL